jgi:hypothetical protein
VDQCMCKPGFGSVIGEVPCRRCPAGTFAEGGDREECASCPAGSTSAPGSSDMKQCWRVHVEEMCPAGTGKGLCCKLKAPYCILPQHSACLTLMSQGSLNDILAGCPVPDCAVLHACVLRPADVSLSAVLQSCSTLVTVSVITPSNMPSMC